LCVEKIETSKSNSSGDQLEDCHQQDNTNELEDHMGITCHLDFCSSTKKIVNKIDDNLVNNGLDLVDSNLPIENKGDLLDW
jgi:hypothetical protein